MSVHDETWDKPIKVNPPATIIGESFWELYENIRGYVKKHGKLVRRASSDWGADVYDLKGIKIAETDVGYGSQLFSESFHYWADYRSTYTQYSKDVYRSYLDEKALKDEMANLKTIAKFLTNQTSPNISEWKDTLDDDFWLEKFKRDYPESHILS
jgi:hypothetical protein